jgi:hypothetical protein
MYRNTVEMVNFRRNGVLISRIEWGEDRYTRTAKSDGGGDEVPI